LVATTVENADRLLDIWIKVLSQSEHTQRLLLDGQWQGSTEVLISADATLKDRMKKHSKNHYGSRWKHKKPLSEKQSSLARERQKLRK
jgi:DASH complex subunit Duo1